MGFRFGKLDIMAITETWLKPGDNDSIKINNLCPDSYVMPHKPRDNKSNNRGGGVGLLHKDSLKVDIQTSEKFASFEHSDYLLNADSKCVRLIVVYRSPPSKANCVTHKMFMDDFAQFLEQQVLTSGQLLIVGDFNYHVDNPFSSEGNRIYVLYSYGVVAYPDEELDYKQLIILADQRMYEQKNRLKGR